MSSIVNFFKNLFNSSKKNIDATAKNTPPTNPVSTTKLKKFVFLDTETTGLNREGLDEIVEIAIVDEEGNTLLNTLVQPRFTSNWTAAERVHGIKPSDVTNAPNLYELLPEIERICTDKTVVCYNAPFDIGFFPNNFFQSVECAMRRFSEVNPNTSKWVSLEKAALTTDYVPQGKSHRALEDAMACRHVWLFGLDIAKKAKEELPKITINAEYKTADGKLVIALFNDFEMEEFKHVVQGDMCTLWTKESHEVISIYRPGTMGGKGRIATLRKEDNQVLSQLVNNDNFVQLHVKEIRQDYYDCEIVVSKKAKPEDFLLERPVKYDEIDNDIYRCVLAYKSLCEFIGTAEQLSLVEIKIAEICHSNGGRLYKSLTKGAKFVIIFSPENQSAYRVNQLQSKGFKVTTFDKAVKYFSIEHMWNMENYFEYRNSTKKFVDLLD